ncbi:MAG: aldose 1-epimerase [Gordonia polyisoprenivorans]|nr:aldose 1-epimerase [Gordonia polyisoprenivorans]
MAPGDLVLRSGEATVGVSPASGSLTSLRIKGTEYLYQGPGFGCFPMAPWCGRLRDGLLDFDGEHHRFPRNDPPHALHGTVRDHRWEVLDHSTTRTTLGVRLETPWPFPGSVTHQITLTIDRLRLQMRIHADDRPFPAQAGWHPWFRRHLDVESAGSLELRFAPAWQEERGSDHLPTGRQIAPQEPPWDDCFAMPDGVDVVCEWPGHSRIHVRSDARWVVVYDMREYAVCVEPQSGPPDGLNTAPRVVTPGHDLMVSTTWSW